MLNSKFISKENVKSRLLSGKKNLLTYALAAASALGGLLFIPQFASGSPLVLGAITANQTNSVVFSGNTNVNILRLDLPVTGMLGYLTLNSLTVTSANTNDSDIANVKLWVGTAIAHMQQIGNTQTFSSRSATFSGLTYSLFSGHNYLWITYDIASNAVSGHVADAKINAGDIIITASGGATNPGIQPPATLDPPEYKTLFSKGITFPPDNYQRLYFFLDDSTTNGSLAFIDGYLTPSPSLTTVCHLQSAQHNGLAANPLDGYLYYNDKVWGICRIDVNCNMTPVCPFNSGSDIATFDSQGRYWTFDYSTDSNLVAIDITTCSIVKSYSFSKSSSADFIDMAYNSRDGYIYTEFGRFDTLGNLDLSYSNPNFLPVINHGGVAIGSDHNLYGIGDDGTLSVINLTTDSSHLVYDFYPAIPTVGQSDAASFPPLVPVVPVANFQSSSTTLCTYDCINYTDLSTTNATSWQWSFPGGTPSSSTIQNPQGICYYMPGTFDATLIASNSVGETDTLKIVNFIKVFPTPPTPVITQHHDTLFCTTDPTYTSYQWYDSTTLIPGATDTFLVITHGGNYNVAVHNEFGCQISVGINIAHNVGINEFSANNYISLYPNPAFDQLLIHTSSSRITGKAIISIINVLGEIIQEEKLKWSSDIIINIKTISPGIYFLEMKTESGIDTKRFIKE